MAGQKGKSGGVRENSGRKGKAEELGLPALVEDVLGEDGKKALLVKIAEQAKGGSFAHQQLLMNYIFGKPKEKLDVTTDGKALEGIKHEIIFKDFSK
jgi:hypothetical protein